MTRSVSTFCLFGIVGLGLWLGLTVTPMAGDAASIPVTAEIVHPLGVVSVTPVDLTPSRLAGGVKREPSPRHFELLLYPGRVGESQLQFGGSTRAATIRLQPDGAPVEAIVDSVTIAGDSLTVITVIPVSQ